MQLDARWSSDTQSRAGAGTTVAERGCLKHGLRNSYLEKRRSEDLKDPLSGKPSS
nr:hypothetical protein IGGMDNGE_00551 [Pseudomonas aeruginosa]